MIKVSRRGAALALLLCAPVSGLAQTIDFGNQTCTMSHTLWDYYSNGEYTHSEWELDAMNCFDNPGAGGEWSGDSGWDGGGVGADPPECRSADAAVTATYRDSQASAVGRDINAKPDSNRNEYMAVIYRDASGALRTSQLVAGGAGVSATPATLGTTWDRIVGIIHNHPSDRYCPDPVSCQINRNPSSSVTVPSGQQSDWDTARVAVDNGANASLLTLYIIGPDRQLRAFAYSNRDNYLPYRSGGTLTVREGPKVPLNLTPSSCP